MPTSHNPTGGPNPPASSATSWFHAVIAAIERETPSAESASDSETADDDHERPVMRVS